MGCEKDSVPRNILVYIMVNVKKALENEDYITGKPTNINSSVSIFYDLLDDREDVLAKNIKEAMKEIREIAGSARGNGDEI